MGFFTRNVNIPERLRVLKEHHNSNTSLYFTEIKKAKLPNEIFQDLIKFEDNLTTELKLLMEFVKDLVESRKIEEVRVFIETHKLSDLSKKENTLKREIKLWFDLLREVVKIYGLQHLKHENNICLKDIIAGNKDYTPSFEGITTLFETFTEIIRAANEIWSQEGNFQRINFQQRGFNPLT